jgi:hypothetical protein
LVDELLKYRLQLDREDGVLDGLRAILFHPEKFFVHGNLT